MAIKITNRLPQALPVQYLDNGNLFLYTFPPYGQVVLEDDAISQDIVDKQSAGYLTLENTDQSVELPVLLDEQSNFLLLE